MLVDYMLPYKIFSLEFLLADSTLENIILDHVSLGVTEVFLTSFTPGV